VNLTEEESGFASAPVRGLTPRGTARECFRNIAVDAAQNAVAY
jgi:hypothetical protein